MKIGILSRGPHLYSTRRLREAAEAMGHKVEVLDFLKCYMNVAAEKATIHYHGNVLPFFDAVIPRISHRHTLYGSAVVRQFESIGTFSLNPSLGITRSRDKLRSLQLLLRRGVGMPVTGFASSPNNIDDLIKMVGGPPVVIKILEGTQGVGVVLAETKKAAASVIQAFYGLKADIIIQEFIAESGGADIRCLVIGDKVVAAMRRQAPPGEFRSNLHRGATAEIAKITKKEREAAIMAVKVLGLKVAGVDLLRSHRGPLVMEVNSSPGLRGIEETTGKDVAHQIIGYLAKNAKPINRSRYQG